MIKKYPYTNDLIKESSPYLLQHAHNPVNWEPWGKKALEKAKKENKLLIISIGYSACHWCHVMEHESFENEEVAKLMNTHFVSIKIDREERPDIDQVYMSAVQLLTGSGGWPLNCIALPNGKPIWGGTYFPKAQWMDALTQLAKLYEENPEKAEEYANNLTNRIKTGDLIKVQNSNITFDKSTINESITIWKKNIDLIYGGTNKAPKFPIPNNYQFLLRQAVTNKDDELLSYVKTTLDKIAFGGIYDQIGGGFSRYSTDKKWHIPHFEKMLYDNGQLVSLYSNAYLVTKNNLYKQKVYETLDFVKRELTTKEGAFYSSLDADSYNDEGHLEEGVYYAWKKEELKPLLKEDYKLFSDYYNINEYGLWEKDQYVLIRNKKDKEICKEHSISQNDLNKKVHEWKTLLLKKRSQRNAPRLDDKALTSWNGLMLKGYIDAYRVFNEDEFLKAALKNANFITHTQVKKDGGLYHNYKEGKSTINAHLEDYSIVIDAFTSLYEVTLDEKWLFEAKKLTDYTLQHFHNTKSSFFYFTSDMDDSLITRKIDLYDNVIPSSNSMMARNLFKLSHYYSDKSYLDISSSMLKNMISTVNNYPSGYSNWLNLLSDFTDNYYEIVVSGREASTKIKEINQYYIPNKLMAGSDKESALPLLEDRFDKHNTWIYLCVKNTCQAPEKEVKKALEKIK